MYYKSNYIVHSKGPWKSHKYIKKVGDRYYYVNSDDESKIREYDRNIRDVDRTISSQLDEKKKYENLMNDAKIKRGQLAREDYNNIHKESQPNKNYGSNNLVSQSDSRQRRREAIDKANNSNLDRKNFYDNAYDYHQKKWVGALRDLESSYAKRKALKDNRNYLKRHLTSEGDTFFEKALLKGINFASSVRDIASKTINKGKKFVSNFINNFDSRR